MRVDSFKGVKIADINVDNQRKRCKIDEKIQTKLVGQIQSWVLQQLEQFVKNYDRWWGATIFVIRIDVNRNTLQIGDKPIELPFKVVDLYGASPWDIQKRFGEKFIALSEAEDLLLQQAEELLAQYDGMKPLEYSDGADRLAIMEMAKNMFKRIDQINEQITKEGA